MTLFDDLPDLDPVDPIEDQRPREGQVLAERCARHAEAEGWDREGATDFVVAYLDRHGPTSGEVVVIAATEAGYRPHDGRAYGAIFGQLSRRGVIRKAGYTERVHHGHGAPGAVIWQLAEAPTDPELHE